MSDSTWTTTTTQGGGLTKREYYACAAMQGLAHKLEAGVMWHEDIAKEAVELADALIGALKKKQPEPSGNGTCDHGPRSSGCSICLPQHDGHSHGNGAE